MTNFLKQIAVSLIAFSFIFAVVALSGCQEDYLPEYESGYFRYAVRTEKDGNKKAYITGFTKLGEQQKVLVYPEYIDGIKVYGIGYGRKHAWWIESIGNFSTHNLEKIYFPVCPIEVYEVYVNFVNSYSVWWNNYSANDSWTWDKQSNTWKGIIYGYEYYVKNLQKTRLLKNEFIANVSYMYNYENAENNGYYWVDSYDNDVITFIPPNPERLGYLFGGWYKEPECVNQWNFETDKTGKLLNNETCENFATYEGTYLYAKWIKNS